MTTCHPGIKETMETNLCFFSRQRQTPYTSDLSLAAFGLWLTSNFSEQQGEIWIQGAWNGTWVVVSVAPVVSCSSSELPAVGHCKRISSQNVFFSYLGLLTQGLLFSCFSLLYIMMIDSPAEFVFLCQTVIVLILEVVWCTLEVLELSVRNFLIGMTWNNTPTSPPSRNTQSRQWKRISAGRLSVGRHEFVPL